MLIYHEIMVFILVNPKRCHTFAKRYNQKQLAKINRPFPHYINVYKLTGKMLYIVKASEFLTLAFERSKVELPDSKKGKMPSVVQPTTTEVDINVMYKLCQKETALVCGHLKKVCFFGLYSNGTNESLTN